MTTAVRFPSGVTATGAELRAQYGKPPQVDSGEALRRLGLSGSVQPDDAFAFLHPSQEVADAFTAGNLEHYGHPCLGSYATDDGVVAVYDLRPALSKLATGKSVPSSAGGGPRDFSEAVHANFTQPPAPDPDVHVDWHMTPDEWRQLRAVLAGELDPADSPYVQHLKAAGALR